MEYIGSKASDENIHMLVQLPEGERKFRYKAFARSFIWLHIGGNKDFRIRIFEQKVARYLECTNGLITMNKFRQRPHAHWAARKPSKRIKCNCRN